MLFPPKVNDCGAEEEGREVGREGGREDIAPKERFFSRDYSGAEREIAE